MSHTLTASLKQALLSLGFLIAFTGVVVVLLLAAFEDMQHFSLKDEKNYKHTMVGRKLYIIMRLSAHAGGVCNNSWRR